MNDLITLLILLALGYVFGQIAEKRHYKSIIKRERILRKLPVIAAKFPPAYRIPPNSFLVMGSVVISVDYFKRFIASLRNIIGGRVTSYELLIDRARREAILRMKEQAQQLGGTMVFNVKLETASISKGRKQTIGSVEVLAYGTALVKH
ncbi:MAG: heavy metal-binding domain-containing protein [Gammaproteobacteria bacterium]|nr:MAG: heavy metal-binding domain-containing protein [Gammaproteobacteria bacterium]